MVIVAEATAAAVAASLTRLALGVAAFTGEAEALLLLAADPSLFFLGDLTGMETRSSVPKMSEFFFLFLAGKPRLLSSIPPPLLSFSLSSSSPNRDLRPSADNGLATEAKIIFWRNHNLSDRMGIL